MYLVVGMLCSGWAVFILSPGCVWVLAVFVIPATSWDGNGSRTWILATHTGDHVSRDGPDPAIVSIWSGWADWRSPLSLSVFQISKIKLVKRYIWAEHCLPYIPRDSPSHSEQVVCKAKLNLILTCLHELISYSFPSFILSGCTSLLSFLAHLSAWNVLGPESQMNSIETGIWY